MSNMGYGIASSLLGGVASGIVSDYIFERIGGRPRGVDSVYHLARGISSGAVSRGPARMGNKKCCCCCQ